MIINNQKLSFGNRQKQTPSAISTACQRVNFALVARNSAISTSPSDVPSYLRKPSCCIGLPSMFRFYIGSLVKAACRWHPSSPVTFAPQLLLGLAM